MPSLKRIWQVVLPLVILVGTMMAAPSSSLAVGSFNNAVIADYAINHYPDGTLYGSCRQFVNDVVKASTGINVGTGWPDYFAGFESVGAQRIYNISDLRKGDIVQYSQFEPNVHTFIIVGQVSGSTFDVIDSNHDPINHPNRVYLYPRTGVMLDNTHRAYRLGTVVPPPTPPPPPTCGVDLNCDGHVNVFDMSIFLNHWQQIGYGIPEDFNHDNIVNMFDLSILLAHYGT